MARTFRISTELKNLETVHYRLIHFCNYLEHQKAIFGSSRYDDLYLKIASVVGSIEDVFTLDI